MDFSVRPGRPVTVAPPFTDPQAGTVSSVEWDFGSDDMSVGTRGLVNVS